MKRSSSPSSKDPSVTLKEILASASPPSLLVVTSPDSIRLRRIEDLLREKFAVQGMQVTHLRGDGLSNEDVARLADDSATLSLFSGPRLYVVSQIDKASTSSIKGLCKILAARVPGVTFLILGAPLPASHELVDCAKKQEAYLAFSALKGEELFAWTARELKRAGVKGESKIVVERIIEFAEHSPDQIAQVVTHFALYLDGEEPNPKTLAELFPSSPVAGEFELIDTIISGTPARTEVMFESLLRSGKSPFMFLGMLAKIFGNYHVILNLLQHRIPPATIREQLHMTPWVFNKSLDAAKKLRPQDIEAHLSAIVRADSKLKNRSLGPEVIFGELFRSLRPVQKEIRV